MVVMACALRGLGQPLRSGVFSVHLRSVPSRLRRVHAHCHCTPFAFGSRCHEGDPCVLHAF